MIFGTGKFDGTQGNGHGYAQVQVECREPDQSLSIEINFDDHVSKTLFENGMRSSWRDAAKAGVRYALENSRREQGKWLVVRVVGQDCDTLPGYVAYAAGVATWCAIGFTAPRSVLKKLFHRCAATFP